MVQKVRAGIETGWRRKEEKGGSQGIISPKSMLIKVRFPNHKYTSEDNIISYHIIVFSYV